MLMSPKNKKRTLLYGKQNLEFNQLSSVAHRHASSCILVTLETLPMWPHSTNHSHSHTEDARSRSRSARRGSSHSSDPGASDGDSRWHDLTTLHTRRDRSASSSEEPQCRHTPRQTHRRKRKKAAQEAVQEHKQQQL